MLYKLAPSQREKLFGRILALPDKRSPFDSRHFPCRNDLAGPACYVEFRRERDLPRCRCLSPWGLSDGGSRSQSQLHWVDIEQVARGKVIEIGWRSTRVLTLDSIRMILPNSQVARRRIINYSAPKPQYRAQLSLKLAHEVPVDAAKEMILKAVGEARLFQTEPAPDIRLQELGRDGNSYAVRFWLTRFERDVDCRDELLSLIDRAMRQAKVPTPRHSRFASRPLACHAES